MERRILFAGTPEISVSLFNALCENFNVVGVLTAMDKPVGRSSVPVPSPVKVAALEKNIPVLQYESLRTQAREDVKALGADTLVTFAFGKIFGPKFLELFPNGKFNVHPSALPALRGPAPIQFTLLNGLSHSCISLQTIGLGMDEGEIWDTFEFDLDGSETNESLTKKTALIAAERVPLSLKAVFEGKLVAREQVGNPTYCSMIDKEMAFIDFNLTAREVHARIRAMYPWPKAWAKRENSIVMFTSVWGTFEDIENLEPKDSSIANGTVVTYRKDRGIAIACSDKLVWITGLQVPGKKELDYKAFINGNASIIGTVLNAD